MRETTRPKWRLTFGLINNAGVDRRRHFADLSVEEFDWVMNANLRHAVFAAQKVIPQMRKLGRGSIVNTMTWMRGIAEVEAYSSAKAAIVGFTNSLAREVGMDRIRANTIVPGYVATSSQQDKSVEKRYLELQCLPDAVKPSDIAEAAVFLCLDAAKMITKQCLTINAGSL
jgi:D-xylose 1-dehydrogenase